MFAQHAAEHAGFWAEYYELITSPAHIANEVTVTLIIDGILIGLIVKPLKRYWIRRHDAQFHEGEHE